MTTGMNAAGVPVVRAASGKGHRTKRAALRAQARAVSKPRPRPALTASPGDFR